MVPFLTESNMVSFWSRLNMVSFLDVSVGKTRVIVGLDVTTGALVGGVVIPGLLLRAEVLVTNNARITIHKQKL